MGAHADQAFEATGFHHRTRRRGGVALAARAQQPERVRRIGILVPSASDNAEFQARVGAFLQGLAVLGWTIGCNVRIDTRWATPNAADIRRHAAELTALAKHFCVRPSGDDEIAGRCGCGRVIQTLAPSVRPGATSAGSDVPGNICLRVTRQKFLCLRVTYVTSDAVRLPYAYP
jgi:hypothetical protein